MQNQIIKSTVILSISSIFAKFLGIFFRWPLVMLIGDEGIGYYQMTYPLYMFFIGIVSGMPIAVSKLVSERSVHDDREGIYNIVRSAFKIMIILGMFCSLLLLVFSKKIIEILKWDSKVYLSLIGMAISPICVCVLGVFRGLFQGFENMIPTGTSQIIEQISRVIFGISLAFLLFPMGIEYSAGGASFGGAVGGLISSIFIIMVYMKFRKKYFKKVRIKKSNKYFSKILKMCVPLSLGATVSTIMVLIDSILVPRMLLNAGFGYKESTILYGQLTGKVSVLINVPLTLSIALGVSIIPALSKLHALKHKNKFKEKVVLSLKISSIISFPCFIALYFLASPIMNVIFPNNSEGFEILKYASISIPFIIYCQITTSILQSTNNYIIPVINLLIGCVLKILITLTLTSTLKFNIYGAVLATIFSYVLTSYLNLKSINRKLNIKVNILEIIISPLLSSLVMIIIVLLSFDFIYKIIENILISLGICSFIGVIIYGIMMVIFKRREISEIFLSMK